MQNRTIIIGDVHGCFDELTELLDKCQATSSDYILSVGDVVDRGPKVREVVDFFMKLDRPDRRSMVLGNHERTQLIYYEKWLKVGAPTDVESVKQGLCWRSDYHYSSFVALSAIHFSWFATLPKYLFLPEYVDAHGNPVTVVHAGCLPDVPLEEQQDSILLSVSNILYPPIGGRDYLGRVQHGYWRAQTRSWWTSKAPANAPFWASIYDGSNGHVVFGHSGFTAPARFPHATGIDTGCCFGRTLCALVLPDWRFVTVQAHKTYKTSKGIRLFEPFPGIFLYS